MAPRDPIWADRSSSIWQGEPLFASQFARIISVPGMPNRKESGRKECR
jgi:hypothetical protein